MTGSWTFLTNHAQVLLCVAENRMITTREISEIVGITERSAQRLLDDLEAEGYITRHRVGRRNRYEIHPEISMRHPAQRGVAVKVLLDILAGNHSD
ncbi:helix-turn-helix transcriptional regulator [Limnochorda pilosa]|uniref:Regulatory protein ArsR n=1 Tax=Limnochorda pilosa TaxID=1555112 RepID=A0A0K2SIE8_LIMPI|nr:MarR family transcriptional regulator [Limnochorda pilosa]BAS26901.1 regulatory protein ArsR [Limnochorda pilosa]